MGIEDRTVLLYGPKPMQRRKEKTILFQKI